MLQAEEKWQHLEVWVHKTNGRIWVMIPLGCSTFADFPCFEVCESLESNAQCYECITLASSGLKGFSSEICCV